jgi:hypothetical protein
MEKQVVPTSLQLDEVCTAAYCLKIEQSARQALSVEILSHAPPEPRDRDEVVVGLNVSLIKKNSSQHSPGNAPRANFLAKALIQISTGD